MPMNGIIDFSKLLSEQNFPDQANKYTNIIHEILNKSEYQSAPNALIRFFLYFVTL